MSEQQDTFQITAPLPEMKPIPYWKVGIPAAPVKKTIWQKIKSIFKREPQFPAHTWQTRDWLSRKVQDAQYSQMKNHIFGVQ